MFGLPKDILERADKHRRQFMEILRQCLKVKTEDILLISDYGHDGHQLAALMAYSYYAAARGKELNVHLLFQEPKKGFMQADQHIIQALGRMPPKNIIILCVSNKLGRLGEEKSFRTFCQERQHRFISSTGLGDVTTNSFDLFMEAMSINYNRLRKKGEQIKKLWDKAKELRITTEAGTDFLVNVEGMEAVSNVGDYSRPGKGGNMPTGEVYIPPRGLEGVSGKVIVDASMKTIYGTKLAEEPVTLIIEKGRVIRMEGKDAPLLEKTFQKLEDRAEHPERVRLVGEVAVGINPGAVLIGSMIMDEKVLGTGHIAIGSNYWFGGEIKTIFHADQVFKSPTVYADGKKMEI